MLHCVHVLSGHDDQCKLGYIDEPGYIDDHWYSVVHYCYSYTNRNGFPAEGIRYDYYAINVVLKLVIKSSGNDTNVWSHRSVIFH